MSLTPRLDYVECPQPASVRGSGHRMAYWEWGDPDNPRVLICVHGLSRQGRDFDVLAQSLVPHYRVICPDVVGRGQSDWLADAAGYQLPTYVADMLTLLAQLRLAKVDWVGTSMGGLIGLLLASMPESPLQRLVLNDVGPTIETAALTRISSYVGQPAQWPSLGAATAQAQTLFADFGPHSAEQWQALTRHMVRWAGTHFEPHLDPAVGAAFRYAYAPGQVSEEANRAAQTLLWQAYERISCPTLLLRGEYSDLLSASTAQAMAQTGPRAQVHTVAGVGHAPTLLHAEQLAVVHEFLRAA